VANVGTRPTLGGTQSRLEVHLFDVDSDIYGHYIHVDFLHKLRPEQRFASLEELVNQIRKDAMEARAFHEARRTNVQ
jgi:riboflavin kinase/FMN adenylyltransferase